MKIVWACPKCGAKALHTICPTGKCGRGKCKDNSTRDMPCQGVMCECDYDDNEDHGVSFEDFCRNAVCYHCGWYGRLPQKPKTLKGWQIEAWAAGWRPVIK